MQQQGALDEGQEAELGQRPRRVEGGGGGCRLARAVHGCVCAGSSLPLVILVAGFEATAGAVRDGFQRIVRDRLAWCC